MKYVTLRVVGSAIRIMFHDDLGGGGVEAKNKDAMKFDSYSKILIFESFSAVQFNSKLQNLKLCK